jgi:WD40 repeat protein
MNDNSAVDSGSSLTWFCKARCLNHMAGVVALVSLLLFGCVGERNISSPTPTSEAYHWSLLELSPRATYLADGEDNLFTLSKIVDGGSELLWQLHTELPISSLVFLEGEKIVAIGMIDGSVELWDTQEATQIWHVPGCTPDAIVADMALVENDILICASGSADTGNFTLWDLQTQESIGFYRGHRFGIYDISWSQAASLLATSSISTNYISLWDLQAGQELVRLSLEEQLDGVTCLEFSPDGGFLASGFGDTMVVWDIETRAPVYEYEGMGLGVHSLAWSPDSVWLAASSGDGKTILLNLGNREPNLVFESAGSVVSSLAFTSDGRDLVSANQDGSITHWAVSQD